VTRTFDRGVDIETAGDHELEFELRETLEYLADDLRVCGRGYPSPRYETLRAIIREQERRKFRYAATASRW